MSATKFIRAIAAAIVVLTAAAFANAHPPTGIVVDRHGRVYFSDLETIWKIEPDGRIALFRDGVPGRHVHELFIDSAGNVYGSDISYDPATQKYTGSVWKMSPSGELSWLQQPTDNAKPGISNLIDRAGNMYSIDQNNHTKTRTLLLRRAPDGAVTTLAGGAYGHADGKGAAAKFSSVGALTIAPDGNIYLTDGTSVRKVTMDGTVATIARNLEVTTSEDSQGTGGLTGLSVDGSGNVYVADPGRRRLLRVKPDGKVEGVYRGEPPYFPNGVYSAADGSIFVLEPGLIPPSNNIPPRVRKISRDGMNVVLVTLGQPAGKSSLNSGSIGTGGIGIVAGGVSRIIFALVAAFCIAAVLIAVVWWRRRHGIQRA